MSKLNLKKILTGLIILSIPFFLIASFNSPEIDTYIADRSLNDKLEEKSVIQVVTMPPIPNIVYFAYEKMPSDYQDVYESLQREILTMTYWHASMVRTMQLANRHEKYVKDILIKEGLHPDFFYLCIAESGLLPVFSPSNAGGYWQFLVGTAREYGLIVNEEVDERFNWEKSTKAAVKYLKKAYRTFGTWTLAAASYNIGIKNIKDRIEYQSLTNYYDMQFPEETARYLYRVLAYKIMLNNPKPYGFYIDDNDLYPEERFKNVVVRGSVENWSEFAVQHGTNFKMLKMYNEWIRRNGLTNAARRTYVVRVPLGRER